MPLLFCFFFPKESWRVPLHRDTGTRRTRQTPASQSGWRGCHCRFPETFRSFFARRLFLTSGTETSSAGVAQRRDGPCRAICLEEEGYSDTSFPYITLHYTLRRGRGITPPLPFFSPSEFLIERSQMKDFPENMRNRTQKSVSSQVLEVREIGTSVFRAHVHRDE